MRISLERIPTSRCLFAWKLTLLATLLLLSWNGWAQKATISGYLSDANGEMFIGANVFEQTSLVGTSTNQYGFYSLTLPVKKTTIVFSYIGYEKQILEIDLRKDTLLNIRLSLAVYDQDEIVVTAKEEPLITESVQMGSVKLSSKQLKKIPSISGEPDLVKALSLTPGVSNGREGAAGLYVRGGTADQNLILLDEAIVYNPNHLFGLLSVFNPDAVKSVELIKGGFPARYGGRLSAVLDVATREGSMEKWRGNFGLGLTSSRLSVDGPLKKGKTSLMFSGRSAYLDLLTLPIYFSYKAGNVDQLIGYTMYDVNAKLSHRFNDKNRLFVSVYSGKDNYRIADQSSIGEEAKFALIWGNTTATIRNNTLLSQKLFWKNMFIYSKFDYKLKFEQEDQLAETTTITKFKSFSGLRDFTYKSAFDFVPSPKHYIKFGLEVTNHLFTPQKNEFSSTDTTDGPPLAKRSDIAAFESAVFLEDEWEIVKNFKANVGLRFSSFSVNKKTYTSFEPRISLLYQLPKNYALKAAFSSTKQYIHLLTNTGTGLSNDIWVPTTDKIEPQQSAQYSLGLVKKLEKYDTDLSLEAYYKPSSDLIELKEGSTLQIQFDQNWDEFVETNGVGTSYGIEFMAQKTTGKLTGILSYTYSKHTRQFERINQGKIYPFKYDNRHNLTLTANYEFHKHWDVSATWIYKTGNPVSIPVAIYDSPAETHTIPAFTEKNNYRLPAYHRADLAFNHTKKTKRNRLRTWTISVYNLYYRKNAYFARLVNARVLDENNDVRYEPRLQTFTLFPIIPSVSYSLEF